MKLRGLGYIIVAALAFFICSPAVHAQHCMSAGDLAIFAHWRPSKPVWFRGLRLVTVSYNWTGEASHAPGDIQPILESAVAQWNFQASNTGIVFIAFNV